MRTDAHGGITSKLPFVVLQSFLKDASAGLLDQIIKHQSSFQPATVVVENVPTVNLDMRRALTLVDPEFTSDMFREKLKEVLQPALKRLGMEGFPFGEIEVQVTHSGHGDYYRMHHDADDESTRELSFVYFLHREPRAFSGGELRIFDDRDVEGLAHAANTHLLTPRNDVLVFFPSRFPHELLPVRVPSNEFGDGRFTVNGWIHRVAK